MKYLILKKILCHSTGLTCLGPRKPMAWPWQADVFLNKYDDILQVI